MRNIDINDKAVAFPLLMDKHGRKISYLRFSLTNVCNLRCKYCMPEKGLPVLKNNEILHLDEINRLVDIFAKSGIKKIRLTGGEPFVHKNIIEIIEHISGNKSIDGLFVTTNGVDITAILESIGDKLSGVNLSLDSVNRQRFIDITKRDRLGSVLESIDTIQKVEIPLKINTVLLSDTSNTEILDILTYVKTNDLNLRFIEEMPFNGSRTNFHSIWNFNKLIEVVSSKFEISKVSDEHGTNTKTIYIDTFNKPISFIPAFTRTFCGDCTRVRVTSDGYLKNCLYGKKDLDLKQVLRTEQDDRIVACQINKAISGKLKDGFASETDAGKSKVSMSMIGG